MGLTDLKKELNKLEKSKLIEVVLELYKKNKSVKDYFDFYINPNEKELFNKYQKIVFESFYPKRGFGLKLKEGKQAISDFKKFEPSTLLLSDLMLYYVETGVKFTNDFGDIDENFYVSVEKMFIQALTLMNKEDILDEFSERALKVVSGADGTGWGFFDSLASIHSEFYWDDSEE